MSKITSTIAATLIATASFATAALASGGTYYEGAVEPAPGEQASAAHQTAPKGHHPVSYGYTGSISHATGADQSGKGFDGTVTLNRGDYYEGAVRPN
ncbi:hypothetical protein MOV61_23450 [Neorhizobium sp. BETTINA12A]|uniref:hypothetical protein n=1 Tax=Neorhizobium sp. BETTINA12A TaxID=2908924 RepID=UPI001FF10FDB|nr:hypothetical protein [Neorhizobium sp. BETTINA12A]MCJ9753681.1 hypothetical protein [Neorhizobium sp. BETTINA12A]